MCLRFMRIELAQGLVYSWEIISIFYPEVSSKDLGYALDRTLFSKVHCSQQLAKSLRACESPKSLNKLGLLDLSKPTQAWNQITQLLKVDYFAKYRKCWTTSLRYCFLLQYNLHLAIKTYHLSTNRYLLLR